MLIRVKPNDLVLKYLFQILVLTHVFTSSSNALFPNIRNNKVFSAEVTESPPSVGAFRKNFKGEVSKVISEIPNSETTLPLLRYEDHTWEGHSIELECNATYPVQWIYSGFGAPPVHTVTYRNAPDFFNEASYSYTASVVFTHTTEKQTGNYSCQGVHNPELNAYLYVFVPGNGIFIADVEENETIIAQHKEPWVTLPCSVADSEAKVMLLKKHSGGAIEVLRLGSHLTFDPKVGFQIQWNVFHEPWAEYICVAQTDDNTEQLEIRLEKPQHNVIPDISTPSSPLWAKNQPGVRFINDVKNSRIVCCSSTNERPTMKSTGCSSQSDCQLRKKYLEAKKCPPTCEQHVVNVGRTCVAYEMSDWHDSGILQCSLPTLDEYYVFSKDENTLITNFSLFPAVDKILKMSVENSPKKGFLYITCHANSFFFSHGLRWALKRPTGALEFVDEKRFPSASYLEVNKKENLGSTVYCFAPVWDSTTEWKSVSIVIK